MADGWRPCRAPRFAASAGGRWNAGGRRGVHLMHLEVHLKKGAGCPGAFIITRRSGATVSRTEPNRTGDKKAPAHHVFFRNPTRVERYHRFPLRGGNCAPARMQSSCNQIAISFVAGARVRAGGVFPEPKEVERYHRFPRRAVTLWPDSCSAPCSTLRTRSRREGRRMSFPTQ